MIRKLKATAKAIRAKTYKSNKPEWMPDENEIDSFVDGCEQYDRNYVLDRWGKLAQRKLLEYLIKNYTNNPFVFVVEILELEQMLKQLESK